MKRVWLIALFFITLVWGASVVSTPTTLAQEEEPQQNAAPLTLFTRYPAQEAAIGENITFELILRTGTSPQIVRLNVEDLPEGWTASFRGGGRVIQAAYVELEGDTPVDLRVEPPADVATGVYNFSVVAQGEAGEAELPIELTVTEKLPPRLEFEVELPTLRGTPETTFRYNVTLTNEGDEDLAVNLVAEAPAGVQVSFKLSNQDVTNIPVAAGEAKRLSVEAQVFPDLPAGAYPINVLAQGGEVEAMTTLTAEVTGQAELVVTAPNERLSGQAYAGTSTPLKVVVQNTGSAPARNIELSASQPSGWSVEFEPQQIAELPSGQQLEVTANIQPAGQAVAGDYVVTVSARPEDGPAEEADFRITVLTSTLWGVVGIALIAVAVAVVGLAVTRFGRR